MTYFPLLKPLIPNSILKVKGINIMEQFLNNLQEQNKDIDIEIEREDSIRGDYSDSELAE